MDNLIVRRCLTVAGALWLLCDAMPVQARAQACQVETVAIDTSYGQAYIPVYLGTAVGQTFMAQDTLIGAISVWRFKYQGEADYGVPMKLWVVRTDSRGYPQVYDVIREGPILRTPADSGASRPIKVRYDFDPPLALPSPGMYAFFIQDPCLLLAYILADTSRNVYPQGSHWQTGRGSGDCHLHEVWREFPSVDLIFEIEFCRSVTTPIRRKTWGEIKTIYR